MHDNNTLQLLLSVLDVLDMNVERGEQTWDDFQALMADLPIEPHEARAIEALVAHIVAVHTRGPVPGSTPPTPTLETTMASSDDSKAALRREMLTRDIIPWRRFVEAGGDIRAVYREAIQHGDHDLALKASRALARRSR